MLKKARNLIIKTNHGEIETPNMAFVATHGRIKDIFTTVEKGIDLFDCVIPTREARHGILYTKKSAKRFIQKRDGIN